MLGCGSACCAIGASTCNKFEASLLTMYYPHVSEDWLAAAHEALM